MKIKLSKSPKANGRIILELTPGHDKVEQKVMRSIASSNFGETVLIKHRPIIELRFNTKQRHKVIQPVYPADHSKPEIRLVKPPAFDPGEYEELLRTCQAHAVARSIGLKIPYALAKKFTCRCGAVFAMPSELIDHRQICTNIHQIDLELLQRTQRIIDRAKAEEEANKPKPKKREAFSCRCGHEFPNKSQLVKHQKLCSALKEDAELFERAKSYFDRNKDESKTRKNKKASRVGLRVSDKPVKRRSRRARTSRKSKS